MNYIEPSDLFGKTAYVYASVYPPYNASDLRYIPKQLMTLYPADLYAVLFVKAIVFGWLVLQHINIVVIQYIRMHYAAPCPYRIIFTNQKYFTHHQLPFIL